MAIALGELRVGRYHVDVALALGMATNFVCSIAVVFLNKWLFAVARFRYGTLLSIVHFALTWLGLAVCARARAFAVVRLAWRPLCALTLVYALSVPACNLSIRHNTIGFYQISKALVTPVAVAVQFVACNVRQPRRLLAPLVPIVVGVAATGATDVSANVAGTLCSAACVVCTVLAQIWIQQHQLALGINSMQLLYYVVPLSLVVQAAVAPAVDDLSPSSPDSAWNFALTPLIAAVLLLTGVLAFFINFTVFFVLKRTSPVTYQVFSHLKTCTIILGGFALFGQPLVPANLFGTLLTLVGVFWYSHVKLQASSSSSSSATTSTATATATATATGTASASTVDEEALGHADDLDRDDYDYGDDDDGETKSDK